jgi:Cu(I)/Ag(I) efflux system membrane protein CusA/SilA
MIETWVELKPRDQWRDGMTPEKLKAEMDDKVGLPGMMNSWGYPIKTRIEMLSTGLRTPVGVKIAGPELSGIDKIARKVEEQARQVPGTRSAVADRVRGANYIEIVPDRREIARRGIELATVQRVIQTALGGRKLDESVEGRARYPIMLRYDRPYRDHISDLDNILVPAGQKGEHVPLADLADIRVTDGPATIKSENARLNGYVFVDITDRALGSYVEDLRKRLRDLDMPKGYSWAITGQYEQMQKANTRLALAIPAALILILTLLYLHFGRWDRTCMILLAVPFGVAGGFWWVWLAGYNYSVAVAVGFIALAGVAVETAMIMLIYIDQQMRHTPVTHFDGVLANIRHGAQQRLRPLLMTVGTIILGLIPIFLTQGPGSDVMRRIALPMVGGMITTLLMTLIMLPVVYAVYMKACMHRDTDAEKGGTS